MLCPLTRSQRIVTFAAVPFSSVFAHSNNVGIQAAVLRVLNCLRRPLPGRRFASSAWGFQYYRYRNVSFDINIGSDTKGGSPSDSCDALRAKTWQRSALLPRYASGRRRHFSPASTLFSRLQARSVISFWKATSVSTAVTMRGSGFSACIRAAEAVGFGSKITVNILNLLESRDCAYVGSDHRSTTTPLARS